MHFYGSLFRVAIALLMASYLLTSCGGSSNGSEQEVPGNETQDESVFNNSTILKVSNIATLPAHDTPTVVFNRAGNGIAVWTVASNGLWLYYSFYDRDTDSWTPAAKLADVMPQRSEIQEVSTQVASNGTNFAVAWQYVDSNLHLSLFNDGQWVTSTAGVSDTSHSDQYQLSSNGQGYLATWREAGEADNDRIYASISENGATWNDATLLSEDTQGLTIADPQVTTDGSGYAVVWQVFDHGDDSFRIAGNTYDGSSWKRSEELYSSNRELLYQNIASNGRGYSLVWFEITDELTGSFTIFNRTYTESNGWSQTDEVTTFSDIGYISDIVSNNTGYCITVHVRDAPGPGAGLYTIIDANGDGNWSTPTRINQTLEFLYRSTLLSDGSGYAVAWVNDDLSGSYHYFASVYADNTWNTISDDNVITSDYLDTLANPPIAIDGMNGQYLSAFNTKIDGIDTIIAMLFDSNSGWSDPITLETGSGVTLYPTVATNPQQGISVIWQQISNNGSDLSTYSNQWISDHWSGKKADITADYFLGSSYDTQLISSNNGDTLAVWSQDRIGSKALYANIKRDDEWENPILLSGSLSEYYNTADIASDGTGFAVTWHERVDDEYIRKAIVINGDDWNDSLLSNISVIQHASYPISVALASNGDGYMLLSAEEHVSASDVSASSLIARHFDGNRWQEPETLALDRLYAYSFAPQIATNGSTYFTAWVEEDGDTLNIYSSRYDNQTWSAKEVVDNDLEPLAYPEYWLISFFGIPRLESNGESYGIFWIDRGKVKGSFYTDSLSDPVAIGDINPRNLHYPRVVANGIGYAVAWQTSDDSGYHIAANVYNGTDWTGESQLSESTPDLMFDMDDSHNVIKAFGEQYAIVWGVEDSENRGHMIALHANIYSENTWSDSINLYTSSADDYVTNYQLASNDNSFLAGWVLDSGLGEYTIDTVSYSNNSWNEAESIDSNSIPKYDLSLTAHPGGYSAIWTRADEAGDPWVTIPWAVSGEL